MELVALYIDAFRGISKTFLPLNSSFSCSYREGLLIINEGDNRTDYYDSIPSTLVIGKNGSGKTTILSFIEDLNYGNLNRGFSVWYEYGCFYIITKGIKPPSVTTKREFKILNESIDFFVKNKVFFIKSNNTVDFNEHLFGSKKTTGSNFIDISLARTNNSKRGKIREISKIFTFLENKQWLPEPLVNDNIEIISRLSLEAAALPKKILSENILSESDENNIKDLLQKKTNEFLSNRQSSLTTVTEIYPYINEGFFFSFLNTVGSDQQFKFFSYLFNKNGITKKEAKNYLAQMKYVFSALFHTFSKNTIKDKRLSSYLYLRLLIIACFSDSNNLKNNIEFEVKDVCSDVVDEKSLINNLLILFKNIENLEAALRNLSRYSIRYKSDEKSFDYFTSVPSAVVDTIKRINSLPKELDSLLSVGWKGLSSGEVSFLHTFSNLYHTINTLTKKRGAENLIILLDEVDLYLHPEWQRNFFTMLLTFLKKYQFSVKIQLIISTHSPVIASDFLPTDIVTLEKKEGNQIVAGEISEIGYGATIDNFMTNGFFLKATIGDKTLKTIDFLLRNRENKKIMNSYKYITSLIKSNILKYSLGLKK